MAVKPALHQDQPWQDAVFVGIDLRGIIALENLRWQDLGALVRGHISLESRT